MKESCTRSFWRGLIAPRTMKKRRTIHVFHHFIGVMAFIAYVLWLMFVMTLGRRRRCAIIIPRPVEFKLQEKTNPAQAHHLVSLMVFPGHCIHAIETNSGRMHRLGALTFLRTHWDKLAII